MSKRPKAKKYRARNEIIEDMLNAALDGATKTKIMYKAYLSGAQLKEYLPFALERGLLEYDQDRGLHFVTMKGRAFLRKINDLKI
jgi:predicted transcriptional regulator